MFQQQQQEDLIDTETLKDKAEVKIEQSASETFSEEVVKEIKENNEQQTKENEGAKSTSGSGDGENNKEAEPIKPKSRFPMKPAKKESIEDIENNLKSFREFLEEELYEDIDTLHLLKCLHRYYWDYSKCRLKISSLLIEQKFPECFKKLLVYANSVGVFKSDSIWFPCYYTLSVLWNFTDASKDLAKRLVEIGFIKYFGANLKHEPYIENEKSKNVAYVLKSSLSTIQNCVRHVPTDPVYEEEGLKEVLKPYLSSENTMFRTLTIMVLSNILTEDENSKLEDAGSIPFMVKCMSRAVTSPKKRFSGFSILELLECISRIAVNDANKIKLVEAGVLPELVKIMQGSVPEEQHMAAKATWTLCFDDDVKNKVVDEPGCVEALENLANSENEFGRQAAKGALWKIYGEEKHQKELEGETPTSDEQRHIFISYQHTHQDMVVKVKDKLKEDGYKVWIDTEQMGGSTLESMALAVENAQLVIVCASEKYKLSPNCRTEAEYTFQIKRPILPLMMQRHYKPDGWLGMLMGAKMYINFDGKYEFNKAYQMLIKELTAYINNSRREPRTDVTDGSAIVPSSAPVYGSAPLPSPIEREPSALKWNKTQVMEWVVKHEIDKLFEDHSKIQNLFEKMDGKHLTQFCKMKRQAPEFFYNQLSGQYELDLLTILSLTEALDTVL